MARACSTAIQQREEGISIDSKSLRSEQRNESPLLKRKKMGQGYSSVEEPWLSMLGTKQPFKKESWINESISPVKADNIFL
jgi:hypothetical protein